MSLEAECVECGTKAKFHDVQDIRQSKWRVLAWIVPTGQPRAICPDCKYGEPKKKKK